MVNILVLCDDVWHPAEVVERGLWGLPEEFRFDFVKDAKDILTVDMLADYPLVLNAKSNNLTSANSASWFEDGVTEVGPEELTEYVRSGGGLLSVHSGNAFRRDSCPKYCALVGNSFVRHPPRCEIEVRVTKEHPVAKGVADFVIRDEHYELTDIAPDADIFLESLSGSGGRQVAGYTRSVGDGRVCVLTPGHILGVWRDPMFRRLLVNAMNWCMRREA